MNIVVDVLSCILSSISARMCVALLHILLECMCLYIVRMDPCRSSQGIRHRRGGEGPRRHHDGCAGGI